METERTKRYLTDKDRDDVLKLLTCGLNTQEIAEIMHISKSTVSYIRQAHTACINKDWSTLQRLSTSISAITEWAMKVTGIDKEFLETFPKEPEEQPVQESAPAPVVVPEPVVTREDFLAMYATMQDIRSLLTEIRDMLK